MVETKPYCTPEINDLNKFTNKDEGQSPKFNKYRSKKTLTKYQDTYPKGKINFKGQCSDLEGYIFDLDPIALEKFDKTMKYLGRYLGAVSRNSFQSSIMTDTLNNFTNQNMPTIIPDKGVDQPKTYLKMTNI